MTEADGHNGPEVVGVRQNDSPSTFCLLGFILGLLAIAFVPAVMTSIFTERYLWVCGGMVSLTGAAIGLNVLSVVRAIRDPLGWGSNWLSFIGLVLGLLAIAAMFIPVLGFAMPVPP